MAVLERSAEALAAAKALLDVDTPPVPSAAPSRGLSAAALAAAQALLATDEEDSEILDDVRDVIDASDLQVGERMQKLAASGAPNGASAQLLQSYRADSEAALRASRYSERASKRTSRRVRDRTSERRSSLPRRSRLQALCLEIVNTEQKYLRDLTLLVHTFVRSLKVLAPELIPELAPNCEQLLALHERLGEAMTAAVAKARSDEELVSSIGSELLRVSPFFALYVSYCAHFMHANGLLEQAHKARPALSKAIADAEAQIKRRNIVERGENAPVSLFAFLIKPVQRLCQYPLLFREVLKEMQPPATRAFTPPPPGGTRDAPLCPRFGYEKAEFVLATLEEVAQSVNDKVRLKEQELRLLDELDVRKSFSAGASGSAPHAVLFEPAAVLKKELRLRMDFSRANAAQGVAAPRRRSMLQWQRPATALAAKGRPRSGAADELPLFKLYVFADSLVFASPVAQADIFQVIDCWPLRSVRTTLAPGDAMAEASGSCSLLLHRGANDVILCHCTGDQGVELVELIGTLKAELEALSSRRDGRRTEGNVDDSPDEASSIRNDSSRRQAETDLQTSSMRASWRKRVLRAGGRREA